jgi:hypothetical protein
MSAKTRSSVEGHALSCRKNLGTRRRASLQKDISTLLAALGISIMLIGCAAISNHQFTEPARDWQTRSGQLLYRTAKTTLIGEVLVRFSKQGDFELTFSKGPGLTLLSLRQDESSAEVRGALVRSGWAGQIAKAPARLRGWLELRDKVIHASDHKSVRHVSGSETFIFRF